jgi:CHAT domain-containing protein
VSHDHFELLPPLRARQIDVVRWSGDLQRAVTQRNETAFDRGLFAPFDALLGPAMRRIRQLRGGAGPERLVIVPDGAMHGLPFAALRDPETRRHLIRDVPVELAGSAALYFFSLTRNAELSGTSQPSALFFGDPAFNGDLYFARGLDRLPSAETEVREISELYAPNADVRIGADATVPAFLSLTRDKTVVHIAAHAIANAQAPSRSLLLFAPSENNSGALEAEELLTRLTLHHTRLVVLSTCSSAGGSPVGPEGVAPLVRPLIASGVPAVIGSLWDVEDATAKELLVSFHRHYQAGSDAAVALQLAQVGLLNHKNPGLRSVLAWAPFQVIGHASSPFGPTRHQ